MLVLTSSSFLLILAAHVSSVKAHSFLARRAGPQARNSQPEALPGARKAAPLLARGRGDEGVTSSFLDTAVQRGGGNQLPRSGSKPKITDPATHCPGKDDWAVYDARGSFLQDDVKDGWGVGWKLSNNGKGAGNWGVASQFTMNIVGGFVEFIGADISKVADGANSNFYITSPPNLFKEKPAYEGKANTCDSGGGKPESCMELDIFESDGGCGFSSTTHDPDGNNAGPCKGGGYACQLGWFAPKGKFDMRLEIDDDGCATYYVDTRDGKGMRQIMDKKKMDCPGTKEHLEKSGAMVRSTQWTGWTYMKEHPEFTPSCAPFIQAYNALPQGSEMSIDGARFKGEVVQGKEPKKCPPPPATTAPPADANAAEPPLPPPLPPPPGDGEVKAHPQHEDKSCCL
eukprot:g5863.t1